MCKGSRILIGCGNQVTVKAFWPLVFLFRRNVKNCTIMIVKKTRKARCTKNSFIQRKKSNNIADFF